MGSRVISIGASLDSSDPILDINPIEDRSKAVRSGERSLSFHDSNAGLDQISSPVRREKINRSTFAMKPLDNDDTDLEDGKFEKDREKILRSNRLVKIHNQALLSGLAYCISSCSMILVNKFLLSSYDFNAGISLLLYQNFVSVIIVSILSFSGVISTEPLTWRLIRVWLPVNIIFVGMLVTSMFRYGIKLHGLERSKMCGLLSIVFSASAAIPAKSILPFTRAEILAISLLQPGFKY